MSTSIPRLLLASTSPRRRALLLECGLAFEVITTPVVEIQDPSLGPGLLVATNARLKATPVAELHPHCVVIGADTVVALGERILGKPADMDEAAAMLADLNGKTHTVHSGVCILQKERQLEEVFIETTQVRFHLLTPEERARYHARIEPLDKAGAYAAQDEDGQLIAETTGSFTNVIGLPMEALLERLIPFGIVPKQ